MDRDFWRNELVGTGVTNIVWNDRTYAMPIPSLELEGNPHPGMVQTPGY